MGYYRKEFDKITTNDVYPAKIQIADEYGKTKWISLNPDSKIELIKWLLEIKLTNK